MKKLLFPLIMILLGGGGGVVAGYFTRSAPPAQDDHITANESDTATDKDHDGKAAHTEPNAEADYFKIQPQFIVPIIRNGKMSSVVVTSLALESPESLRSTIIRKEPKLRDVLLRVMFDHASIGGFDGNFVEHGPMDLLKASLLKATRDTVGPEVSAVLVLEIGKQAID